MRSVKSEWTGPERRMHAALLGLGLRPRTHVASLPGRPDFVLDGAREWPGQRPLAILVDGCLWHACPRHFKLPKTNKRFWREKILRNAARDRRNRRRLQRAGVRTMRVWEHDLGCAASADRAARRVGERLCNYGKK